MTELSNNDYYISSSHEPEEWFMTIKLHAFRIEDAVKKQNEIIEAMRLKDIADRVRFRNITLTELDQALRLKREIDDIKNMMNTSEYLYSGEFSKSVMDRVSKIFGDKLVS